MEPYTGQLSTRRTKQLFFNAENDTTVKKVFLDASRATVVPKETVLEEQKPIDPFAHIDERNAEMERVRKEIAMQSDSGQTLVKEPFQVESKRDTVDLDKLPLIVRQAAEAALLRKVKK